MNKLSLEINIKSSATPETPVLQATVSLEALSNMKIKHGEGAVKDAVWGIFSKMMEDLKTPPKTS